MLLCGGNLSVLAYIYGTVVRNIDMTTTRRQRGRGIGLIKEGSQIYERQRQICVLGLVGSSALLQR